MYTPSSKAVSTQPSRKARLLCLHNSHQNTYDEAGASEHRVVLRWWDFLPVAIMLLLLVEKLLLLFSVVNIVLSRAFAERCYALRIHIINVRLRMDSRHSCRKNDAAIQDSILVAQMTTATTTKIASHFCHASQLTKTKIKQIIIIPTHCWAA